MVISLPIKKRLICVGDFGHVVIGWYALLSLSFIIKEVVH